MKRIYTYLVFFSALVISSCSEELEPTPFTFSKYFSGENSKTWKIEYFEETLDGEVLDRFSVSCSTDDQFTLYSTSDRALEIKTGSKRCNEDEPSTLLDTWSYKSSTATLIMMVPAFTIDGSLPFIVREVDSDEMTLEIFFDEAGTGSYRIHFEAIDEE